MNKPKIKDCVLYTDYTMGNKITLGVLIDALKYLALDVKKFENISMDLLKHYGISDEIYHSLFPLLTSSTILEILNDIESNIN